MCSLPKQQTLLNGLIWLATGTRTRQKHMGISWGCWYWHCWQKFHKCKGKKKTFCMFVESRTGFESDFPISGLDNLATLSIIVCLAFFPQDYKPDQDPAIFKSEKTGRGPLGPDWKVLDLLSLLTVVNSVKDMKWPSLKVSLCVFMLSVHLCVCRKNLLTTPIVHTCVLISWSPLNSSGWDYKERWKASFRGYNVLFLNFCFLWENSKETLFCFALKYHTILIHVLHMTFRLLPLTIV